MWIGGGAGAAVVVLAVVLAVALTRPHASSGGSHPTAPPTPVPTVLAPPGTSANGSPVSGISCDSTTSTSTSTTTTAAAPRPTFVHLAVYVNGEARQVPPGIGVGPPQTTQSTDAGPYVSGSCYYWLNTRTRDGVIHVQPPTQASYTLGQFFDIWGQQLSATQVGPASGAVTVLVNGSPYSGDPRAVPLSSHAVIQLDVGPNNVPFQHYTFPAGE